MQFFTKLNFRSAALLTIVAIGTACGEAKQREASQMKFAAAVMQDVLPKLVKSLQQKVTENGVAAAVPFCNEFAPQYGKMKMAEWSARAHSDLGAESFAFRRISSRNRNPQNAPTPAQARILDTWQKGKIEPAYFEDAGKHYTMHPIKITQPLCLSCHGDTAAIDKKTMAEIKLKYPQDRAIGYQLGDLRGAFVTETLLSQR